VVLQWDGFAIVLLQRVYEPEISLRCLPVEDKNVSEILRLRRDRTLYDKELG
jgi:hypothetical protein